MCKNYGETIPEDYDGKLEREAKREIRDNISKNWELFNYYYNLGNYSEECKSFINFLYKLKYDNNCKYETEEKLVSNSRIDDERVIKTSKNQKLYSNLFKISIEKDARNFFNKFLEEMGYQNIQFNIKHEIISNLNDKFLNIISSLFTDLQIFSSLEYKNLKENKDFENDIIYLRKKYYQDEENFIKHIKEKKFKEEILLKNFFLYLYKNIITMDFEFYLIKMNEIDALSSLKIITNETFSGYLKVHNSITLKKLKKIFLINQDLKRENSFEDKLSLVCLYWLSAKKYTQDIENTYFKQIFYEIKNKKEITICNDKVFFKIFYDIYLIYIGFYYLDINLLEKKIESYVKIFYTNFLYAKLRDILDTLSFATFNIDSFLKLNDYYLKSYIKNKSSFLDLKREFETKKREIGEILYFTKISKKVTPQENADFIINILKILSNNSIDFSSTKKRKIDSERNSFTDLFFLVLIMYEEFSEVFFEEMLLLMAYLLDFYQNSYLISNEKGEYFDDYFPLKADKIITFFLLKNTNPTEYIFTKKYFEAAIFKVNYYPYLLEAYS